jgi:hypothetical protein
MHRKVSQVPPSRIVRDYSQIVAVSTNTILTSYCLASTIRLGCVRRQKAARFNEDAMYPRGKAINKRMITSIKIYYTTPSNVSLLNFHHMREVHKSSVWNYMKLESQLNCCKSN